LEAPLRAPAAWRRLSSFIRHRSDWFDGTLALAHSALASPLSDPTLSALRPHLVASSPGELTPSVSTLYSNALARAVERHELEVIAAALLPELARHLSIIQERKRADAILELAIFELADTLGDGAPVALLKGSASAILAYPHTSWRARRDLDLLVGDGLPEIRDHLLNRGWRDAVTLQRQAEGPNRVRTWPMVKALGPHGVSLDLHRRIEATPWCHLAPTAIINGAVHGLSPLPITSPDDTYLTTVAHLVGSGLHEPLKGWVDLARLVPHLSIDFAHRARRFGLATATWFSLGVVARWFHLDTTHLRLSLSPDPIRARLIAHLGAGDHDTPERRPLYKGLSQRLWRLLLEDRR